MRYKKGILIAVIIVIILIISAVAGYFIKDKIYNNNHVVISINSEKVSDSEFKFILDTVKSGMEKQGLKDFNTIVDGKKAIDLAKERSLESINEYKIGAQQAKKQGLALTDAEMKSIDGNIQQIIAENPKIMENLTKNNLTTSDFKRINVDLALANKLREKETASISSNLTITDAEAKAYYDNNQYKYTTEMVRARHILIKTTDDKGNALPNKDALKAKAEDILKKAQAGEDFATLAKQYSEDPGSKDNGGEYTFSRGQMVQEFEDAAFALKPGEISGIVETQYGFHIIKLEEKFMKTYDFDTIKDTVKVDAQYNKMLQDWIKNSKIIKNDKLYNAIV